ncbi:RNA polymerase sigma factor [Nocardiopsis rhodophaea]|uniref:RNA polymerase sigma factor n=1 Tax=Nocardiopsis rhodophaea TaxID=280238 RepID=UPI0031DCFF6D
MWESSDDRHVDNVAAATDGEAEALERLICEIHPEVYRLAVRFFGDPRDAEDATQEALVQVMTRLDRFNGESAFSTWVYRVATNKFLSLARTQGERRALSFGEFDEELSRVPSALPEATGAHVADRLLLEEVKVGCTLAMLLCLDRGHRMAYILGEIMELDHATGATILDISAPAFRKRLQRSRTKITDLMRARCGLIDRRNACRCRLRAPVAVERGCVDPHDLVFASSAEQARHFPEVLGEIRRLDEAERAGALYRSHPDNRSTADLAAFVHRLFDPGTSSAAGSAPTR